VGLVAVVALIALSAGIFSYFATHGGSRRSIVAATPHPTCAPSQATVDLPANTNLSAIAPLGTDDGWAVGSIADPQQLALPPSAIMLRLRNCHWTPVGEPIPHAGFSDISMVSPDEGWAVGVTYAQNVTLSDGTKQWDWDQPLVLHYTHGSWQTVKVSAGPKTTVEKVKMVSASEGWMLLYDGKHLTAVNGVNSLRYGYSLRHYENGTWADVPLDFLKTSMSVSDLDAQAPGEAWLVGIDTTVINNSQSGFAAHYSHGVWTSYAGATLGADTPWFQSISELSPNDVWAAGASGLYHFDGAHWTQASLLGTPSGVPSSFKPYISHISMLSPSQGWAFPDPILSFGIKAFEGMVLRYDHGVWQWTTLSVQGASRPLAIYDFAPSSPTQGWALAFQVVNGFDQYVLLYDLAGAWGVVPQPS
jgi:photosystem II stability/assembly factor-like uncharacterized protein